MRPTTSPVICRGSKSVKRPHFCVVSKGGFRSYFVGRRGTNSIKFVRIGKTSCHRANRPTSHGTTPGFGAGAGEASGIGEHSRQARGGPGSCTTSPYHHLLWIVAHSDALTR